MYNVTMRDEKDSQIFYHSVISGLGSSAQLDPDLPNDFDYLVEKAMLFDFKSINRAHFKNIDGYLREVSFLLKSNFLKKRKYFLGDISAPTFAIGSSLNLVQHVLPDRVKDVFKRRKKKCIEKKKLLFDKKS